MTVLRIADVHLIWMIVAAMVTKAVKLWSVLQERMAIPSVVLHLAEVVFDQMPPLAGFLVDL
ncbi:MAG: hypothetical protein Q4P24_09735, partial [Rhodobacterales bacterium]|nr:hypothetical protein [Rhodobacterales bacterium]